MNDDPVLSRYLSGEYAENNPDWDSTDSPWKAEKVAALLEANGCRPRNIVEIGCGAGGVLANLRSRYPHAAMAGFDIAPHAQRFWPAHRDKNIRFLLGDYLASDEPVPDVTLLLDVLEHLANPFEFLAKLKHRSKLLVVHFPLDLSAQTVLREEPLLFSRRKVGHLHYFTRGLALALLRESGFEVLDDRYTGAAFSSPSLTLKGRIAGAFRRLAYTLHRHAGVRFLGGETLMVLARPAVEGRVHDTAGDRGAE